MKTRITIVATGGTIATKVDPALNAPIPALTGQEIVESVPGLCDLAEVEVVEFSNVASPCINPAAWLDLALVVQKVLDDEQTDGVVITHGTDTLDQTAYFLHLTLRASKPVIVIGAQRNSSYWDADGPRNLINAVRQVADPSAHDRGVTVTMNHYINSARHVRKSHISNVQTFTSGDAGHVGYIDLDRVIFFHQPNPRRLLALPRTLPQVDIISMYAGADGDYVRFAVSRGAEAIVIEAYGLGHVNEAMHDAIAYSISKGVPVIVASKIPDGRAIPIYGYKGAGKKLHQDGVVFAGDLSGDKARVLTMLAITRTKAQDELQEIFEKY